MQLEGIHPPHRVFYDLSIAFCTKSAMRSIENVHKSLSRLSTSGSLQNITREQSSELLDEVQNIVVQAAAVSRYFWPVRKGHEKRAEALKQQYQVTDSSDLRLSKELRDAIEHFDERLDKYLSSWPAGTFFPEYIGIEGKRDGVPIHFFRAYFINSGTFEMLSNRYEIQPIADEIVRIHEQIAQ